LMICLFVLTEFMNVTHTHTDTAWQHRPPLHSIVWQKSFCYLLASSCEYICPVFLNGFKPCFLYTVFSDHLCLQKFIASSHVLCHNGIGHLIGNLCHISSNWLVVTMPPIVITTSNLTTQKCLHLLFVFSEHFVH